LVSDEVSTAQIAEAITQDLIVSNNYPTDVSGELVRLARKTDLDAGPILERMINEKAWLQVTMRMNHKT
jgi:hypothetical protein